MKCHKRAGHRISAMVLASFLLAASLFAAGCDDAGMPALSFKPFFLDQDVETDPLLAGTWTSENGELSFQFEEGDGREYKLVVRETEGTHTSSAEFEAHLVRLGATWFIDFFPGGSNSGSAFYALHLLPAHSLARVDLSADSLHLAFLDGGWLNKGLESQVLDVAHTKLNDTIVLTGDTQEIQKLVDFHANDDKAFLDTVALYKEVADQ